MIHRSKPLDQEITDGENQFHWTYTGETKPSQTLDLKHDENRKVLDKPRKIHRSKGFVLEIIDFEYHHDLIPSGKIVPSQTSNPELCRDYKSFR